MQNLPLRWLLPSSELKRGFCGQSKSATLSRTLVETQKLIVTGHSWSGHRKAPAYVEQIVFPEDLLTALRIVAMKEDEVYHVVGLLEEVVCFTLPFFASSFQGCYLDSSVLAALVGFLVRCIAPGVLLSKGYGKVL